MAGFANEDLPLMQSKQLIGSSLVPQSINQRNIWGKILPDLNINKRTRNNCCFNSDAVAERLTPRKYLKFS
jgi:hypothetical protein